MLDAATMLSLFLCIAVVSATSLTKLSAQKSNNRTIFASHKLGCYKLVVTSTSIDGVSHCEVHDHGFSTQGHRQVLPDKPVLETIKRYRESEPVPNGRFIIPDEYVHSIFALDNESAYAVVDTLACDSISYTQFKSAPHDPQKNDNIQQLRMSGPSSNRIDVVMMGDGYTASEQELCFKDMERLTTNMFQDVTFASYLPVFNIWAICLPSIESGIGVGGRPKNTAFGLYRDGTELRGIYTSKPNDAVAACRLIGDDGCDFPSIIGNDDYYGGLGGQFVIGTKSLTTGTVVLRHEMGHNFVNVGEEYDGGSVYRGVNSATTVSGLGWTHWLTDQTAGPTEEMSAILLSEYPWYDLALGPISFDFTSDGTYGRWFLRFTASGCDTRGSLRFFIDNVEQDWETQNTLDRSFFTYQDMQQGFRSGKHTLRFEQGTPPVAGAPLRQLCSLTLHEYMQEPLFHFDNSYVSAYPTWSASNRKTFRPTNEACLMRNMTSPAFCPVCQEGMWMQFFAKISLIDDVDVDYFLDTVTITVNTIALGQKRDQLNTLTATHNNITREESLSVAWKKDGERQSEFIDQFSIFGDRFELDGSWEVEVVYKTSEVRHDPSHLLTATSSFTV